MKTAVEWFNQQLVDRQNGNGDLRSKDEIFEQAKEMEKQQSDEFAVGFACFIGKNHYKLYNETKDNCYWVSESDEYIQRTTTELLEIYKQGL